LAALKFGRIAEGKDWILTPLNHDFARYYKGNLTASKDCLKRRKFDVKSVNKIAPFVRLIYHEGSTVAL
jgi:hypothetical protein